MQPKKLSLHFQRAVSRAPSSLRPHHPRALQHSYKRYTSSVTSTSFSLARSPLALPFCSAPEVKDSTDTSSSASSASTMATHDGVDTPAVFHRGKYALIVSTYAISKRNVLRCFESGRVLPQLISRNLATTGLDAHRLCGEDAFHVTSGQGSLAIGVADGVGGWQDQGVDAGLMSHRLMELVRDEAHNALANPNVLPLDILSKSFQKLKADRSVLAGSTTACVVSFCLEGDGGGGGSFVPPTPSPLEGPAPKPIALPLPSPSLAAVNVGDSGFLIFRPVTDSSNLHSTSSFTPGKIIFSSDPLQHPGGAPFQLAVIPPHMRHLDAVENEPQDGQQIHVPLVAGDLIVLGTDGLLDNLTQPQIEAVINEELSRHPAVQTGTAAVARSLAQRCIAGPKPDDITIIVARLALSDSLDATVGPTGGRVTPHTVPNSPSPSVMSMTAFSPSVSAASAMSEDAPADVPMLSVTQTEDPEACLADMAHIFALADLQHANSATA